MLSYKEWTATLSAEDIKKIVGETAYEEQFRETFNDFAVADIKGRDLENFFRIKLDETDIEDLEDLADSKEFNKFWDYFMFDLIHNFEDELSEEYEDYKADESYTSDLESDWRNSRG